LGLATRELRQKTDHKLAMMGLIVGLVFGYMLGKEDARRKRSLDWCVCSVAYLIPSLPCPAAQNEFVAVIP